MKLFSFIFMLIFLPDQSQAQAYSAGAYASAGMYSAFPSCPYQTGTMNVRGLKSEVRQLERAIRKLEDELDDMEFASERDGDAYVADFLPGIEDDLIEFLSNNSCDYFKNYAVETCTTQAVSVTNADGTTTVQCFKLKSRSGATVENAQEYCKKKKINFEKICDNENIYYPSEESRDLKTYKRECSRFTKRYLSILEEIEDYEDDLDKLYDDLADAEDEEREARRAARRGESEGDVCIECRNSGRFKPEPWSLAVGAGLDALGYYFADRSVDRISRRNADLGWATNPGISPGWFPWATMSAIAGGSPGVYGGTWGGMGPGSFGCAPMPGMPPYGPMGMNGPSGPYSPYGQVGLPWGNPYGSAYPGYNPYFGGMPMGYPYGMGGGPFAGAGAGVYAGIGGPMGIGGTLGPYGGGPWGPWGGAGAGVFAGAGGPWGPFGPGAGIYAGAGAGIGGPGGFGGPFGGGPFGGVGAGAGICISPMYCPFSGGVWPGGLGGAGGMWPGGLGGIGGLGGLGGLGGIGGLGGLGGLGGMQMQMQLYQQYAELQQRELQNQLTRYQSLGQLQQEMMTLERRYYQIIYGGSSLGGGLGGGGGVNLLPTNPSNSR